MLDCFKLPKGAYRRFPERGACSMLGRGRKSAPHGRVVKGSV